MFDMNSPDENISRRREWHFLKQFSPMILILLGTQKDLSAKHSEKASASILTRFAFSARIHDSSPSQPSNDASSMISTDAGIEILLNDLQFLSADRQIRTNLESFSK
jgi:hypothetical protein